MTDEPDSTLDPGLDEPRELEEIGLSQAELDELLNDDVGLPGLAELLTPDPALVQRVTTRVETRIAEREAVVAVIDLLALGWFTLKAVYSSHNES